jgi:DNA-binding NtrC family response regulator
VDKRRRVLVVDDDVLILAAIERQLASAHEVTVFADPELALAQLRSGVSYDVIVCDLVMPAMSGVQFHAELAECAPAQAERIVLMTGGSARHDSCQAVDDLSIPTLRKPFDGDTLRRVIERLTAA